MTFSSWIPALVNRVLGTPVQSKSRPQDHLPTASQWDFAGNLPGLTPDTPTLVINVEVTAGGTILTLANGDVIVVQDDGAMSYWPHIIPPDNENISYFA